MNEFFVNVQWPCPWRLSPLNSPLYTPWRSAMAAPVLGGWSARRLGVVSGLTLEG